MEEITLSNVLNFYKELGVEYLDSKLNQKKHELDKNLTLFEKLKKEVENCKACELYKTRKNYVFGDGNIDAQLMLIGEAPGATEDEQGLPFVGRAGQLLSELLKEIGIDRKEIYLKYSLEIYQKPKNLCGVLNESYNKCKSLSKLQYIYK